MSIREELQKIYDSNNQVTPTLVVDTARNANNPLHQHFEWDNDIAGEKYRQVQAAEMIRSIRITAVKPDGSTIKVRQYILANHTNNDEDETIEEEIKGRYLSVQTIANDKHLSEAARQQMLHDWQHMQERYDGFYEFTELIRSTARKYEQEQAS